MRPDPAPKASPDRGPGLDPLTESELHSEVVFDGSLLEIRRDAVRLPDGREATREYVRHPGAVVVLAQLDDGRLVFERQFRYPLRRSFLELPAGKIDPGEDALAAAKRELLEETGYRAREWRHLLTTYPVVGYSDERIELYLARDLEHVGHALDEGEFLDVFALPLDQALQWVKSGRIVEAKTIIALLLAQRIATDEW